MLHVFKSGHTNYTASFSSIINISKIKWTINYFDNIIFIDGLSIPQIKAIVRKTRDNLIEAIKYA